MKKYWMSWLWIAVLWSSIGAAELPVTPGITTSERKIAENVFYREERDPAGPWEIRMLILPRHSSQYVVEAVPGKGLSPERESLPAAWQRLTAAHKLPLGAINGDAFEIRDSERMGEQYSIAVSNGEFISSGFAVPSPVSVIFERNGDIAIDQLYFRGTASTDGKTWPILRYNHIEPQGKYQKVDGVYAYNYLSGNWKMPADGIRVRLDRTPVTLPFTAAATVVGRVKAGSIISKNPAEMVLIGFGDAASIRNLPLKTSLKLNFAIGNKRTEPLYNVVGGFWTIREDGEPCSEVKPRGPRTLIAYNRDKIVFIVVDGRQQGWSVGMSDDEMNQMLERLKLDNAANLDGGGSTTMMVGGKVVNRPSDGSPRRNGGSVFILKKKNADR